ncbi:hypothetical protein ACT29H_12440 [Thermophagus sp. OGC60D27]|uniref:hypothetical protein n=1 Tax=Thermophagus sp. OGC60D27 TaxID=3458415 RepID=UPI0040383847
MRRFTIALLYIFFLVQVYGQYYSSGSDPASINWKQINSDRFRLVFPDEFSEAALDLSFYLDSIAPKVEALLNHRPRKINILIHGHSTYSNGFVSWAPRRIELYPTPDQKNYSTDWLRQLAIHEYRHVVQIDKLRKGFTKVASWFSGQQATGAVLGAYIPLWFMEGDAVITETTLSNSGRGRLPSFTQPLRARLVEYGYDHFDKAYLGSYKEFIPDYYKSGYYFTAAVRQRYGAQIWSDVIDNTGRNSWSLIPFRQALRKTGFRNQRLLYNAVFDSLVTQWKKYDNNVIPSNFKLIAEGKDDYTNIEYPVVTNQGEIFAQISGPGQRTQIVRILPNGIQEPLVYTGARNNDPITANDRWVAWTEFKSHIRWENADYSIVRIYNKLNGQTQNLTSRSRYFSPALTSNSDTLAVVESTTDYRFYITLIDINSGNSIKRIPTPSNAFPMHPSWSDQKHELVMVLLTESGKIISTLNTKTNEWVTVRAPSFDEPMYPTKRGDYIWFAASTPNSEEIFRISTKTGATTQMTQSRFGASYPALSDKDSLLYCDYSPRGYRLVKISADQTMKKEVSPANLTNQLVKKLKAQEPEIPVYSTMENPEIEPYSKWNLFNFHSWAPAYFNINDMELYPGFALMSQNLLGTAVITAGFNGAKSKSHEKYHIGFKWRGWFPIFNFDIKWGDNKETFNDVLIDFNSFYSLNQQEKENHLKLEAGASLPFYLSQGKWQRFLQLGSELEWQSISNQNYIQSIYSTIGNYAFQTSENLIKLPNQDYLGMEYSIYFHNKLRGSTRDVNTRWGQAVSILYRHTPWGNFKAGKNYGISSRLYLPGILKHHALVLDNQWQKKVGGDTISTESNYLTYLKFNDLLDLPRGYQSIYNDEMYIFNATYQMPLWNPDWSLPGLLYIKRFRLHLFFDAAMAKYELQEKASTRAIKLSNTYTSTGIELMSDIHAFRFILPFSIGYRGGYRNGDNSLFHELIISTSFNNFLVSKK